MRQRDSTAYQQQSADTQSKALRTPREAAPQAVDGSQCRHTSPSTAYAHEAARTEGASSGGSGGSSPSNGSSTAP